MAHLPRQMDKKTIEQVVAFMKKTVKILEDNQIDYVLDFGTLLGFLREGRILPWDTDIDIGIFDIKQALAIREQFHDQNIDAFYEPAVSKWINPVMVLFDRDIKDNEIIHVSLFQYHTYDDKNSYHHIMRISLFSRTINTLYHASGLATVKLGKLTDEQMQQIVKIFRVLPFRKKLNRILNYVDYAFAKKREYVYPKIKAKYITVYGIQVRIPERAIGHLELAYGKDWETPNPDFSHETFDNTTRVENGVEIWELEK